MMLDAAKATEIVTIREDLAPDFPALMDRLLEGRPTMAGIDLPGRPNAMELVFSVVEVEDEEEERFPDQEPFELQARVRAIIQDGDGLLHRVPLSWFRPGLGARRMVADLTAPLDESERANPVYPLRLVNIEIEQQIPDDDNHLIQVEFHGIGVREGVVWSSVDTDLSAASWTVDRSRVIGAAIAPEIALSPQPSDGILGLEIQTGWGFAIGPVTYSLRPAGTVLPESIPIVVSESFLEEGSTSVGDTVRLTPLGINNDLGEIVGTVRSFPTVDTDTGDAVIVDLATVQIMGYEPGFGLARLDEYWLSSADESGEATADLSAAPLRSQTTINSAEVTDTLVSDPVALGHDRSAHRWIRAQPPCIRRRRVCSECNGFRPRAFGRVRPASCPRAVTASARWVVGPRARVCSSSPVWQWGRLIGVILTATVLPLITVTQSGQAAVPEVIVAYPWQSHRHPRGGDRRPFSGSIVARDGNPAASYWSRVAAETGR